MSTTDCSDFKWDELPARIDGKNIIPVMSQGALLKNCPPAVTDRETSVKLFIRGIDEFEAR
jgi:hypothetical protein